MLALIALLGLLQAAPAPLPASLVADVRTLAAAQDNDQRFDVLTGLLRDRNVPFAVETFSLDKAVGREPRTRGRNIVVTIGEGAREIVVGAHYDAVRLGDGTLSRGAVDNGASSVMLVHLAEVLRGARLPMRLRIVWFDMEETGHHGSLRYLQAHAADRIRAMLNFDINAYGDTVVFGEPPGSNDPSLRRALVETCAGEAIDCMRFDQFPSSDDRPFGKAGIPTLSIGIIPAAEAHQLWLMMNGGPNNGLAQGFAPLIFRTIHTPDDVVDKVDGSTMARMQRVARALVERLVAASAGL